MRIICRNQSCEYCRLGECELTRVASQGTGGDSCAYFVKRKG